MKRGHVVLIVAAVVVGIGVSCTGFREDEIACEQAVVHLADCCPHFDTTRIQCTYDEDFGCGKSGTQYPAFSLDESACLKEKSCDALVDGGICAKARGAEPRKDEQTPSRACR